MIIFVGNHRCSKSILFQKCVNIECNFNFSSKHHIDEEKILNENEAMFIFCGSVCMSRVLLCASVIYCLALWWH